MSPKIELKEGAFIISDAHYSQMRPELLPFIEEIRSKKLKPTQLILMGDIFDALFGGVQYTQKLNSRMIESLNEISQFVEIIYLEGNHDFNLDQIFPNVKTVPIQMQPIECFYHGKKVLLAHGDFDIGGFYKAYVKIVRNKIVLYVLKALDNALNHFIWKRLNIYLAKKDDCKEFLNFRGFISSRVFKKYECDYFIEVHFHQNKVIDFKELIYVNLAAFACNQRYFRVKSLHDKELLEENIFSKGIKV